MKLDATLLRHLSKDDFRVLTAIEMGMKNHQLVPVSLVIQISRLKAAMAKKCIGTVHRMKLVWHDSIPYDGYKLTYAGYDFLALRTFAARGTVNAIGNQIGVGKESDIYFVSGDDYEEVTATDTKSLKSNRSSYSKYSQRTYHEEKKTQRVYVLKLQRLGRVSFKSIKNNRDYMGKRKNASWIYISRIAALKEYAFMKALYEHGFPTPKPIDWNRHCVVMTQVEGFLLAHVKEIVHVGKVYSDLMNLILKLASYGLIHGDFNEFNLMIDNNEKVTMIDFPQMVSTSHPNAEYYFNRDVECVRSYFRKKFNFEAESYPIFDRDVEKQFSLDKELSASGFTPEDDEELIGYINDPESHDQDETQEEGEESDHEEKATNKTKKSQGKSEQEESEQEEEEEESEQEEEEFEPIPESERIFSPANENNNNNLNNNNNSESTQKEETNSGVESDESDDELSYQQKKAIKTQLKKERQKKQKQKLLHNEMKNRKKREAKNYISQYF